MKWWFTIFAAATATIAMACLNDRDAIEFEAKRFPNVMEVSSGRFERNPPRYYEMRIERIDKQGGPKTLADFDDKAVALGRLGRDAEAIKVIEQKAQLMLEMGAKATKMDWYRYHANLGTFQVHKWFAEGAKIEALKDVKIAATNIERSIELNPNAHFGREEVQLHIMNWIIDVKEKKTKKPYHEWFSQAHRGSDSKKEADGLMGLVVLGAAWESPDVFHSVANLIHEPELSRFVTFRVEELERAGKKSPIGRSLLLNDSIAQDPRRPMFEEWRRNADRWHANRIDFMESQFAKGKHPDTDKDFWRGYREISKPQMPRYDQGVLMKLARHPEQVLLSLSLVVLTIVGFILRFRAVRRAQVEEAAAFANRYLQ